MNVGEAYDKKYGKKKKSKYAGLKQGPLTPKAGTSFGEADLKPYKGKHYRKPKYRGGGADRERYDENKGKWVSDPE